MANENSVFSANTPVVESAPESSGNPLDNSWLSAIIQRATAPPVPGPSVLSTPLPEISVPQSSALGVSNKVVTLPEGTQYSEEPSPVGPITLPEGTEYQELPKNLSEAHALGLPFNPLTDFDSAGLVDAAKQKAFNPVDLLMNGTPEQQQDPAIREKVANAFMDVWQYSEKHPLEGISVGSVAKSIAHLGKGIFDWAKNHIDAITSLAGGDKNDARTKAAENILELQLAGTQLGYQGEDLAKWLARRVFKENIVKPLSEYSPEEKDKALQDEIDRRKLTQRILGGKTLTGAEKLPLSPEKIASMAGADPLQFLAFEGAGAAAKTGLKLVPELGEAAKLAQDVASQAAPKVAGVVIKGIGKTAEVAAKPVAFAAKGAESTVGEYLAAHLLGPPGVILAKAIGKAGKALPKLAKAGTSFGEQLGEGVTSDTAQAAKSILQSAPYSIGDVLSGAAYDAAFAAPAKSPEEREGIGLGTALGLAGGLKRAGLHTIGGQLVGERKGAWTPGMNQLFHDTYNTGYEHQQFSDVASGRQWFKDKGLAADKVENLVSQRGGSVKIGDQNYTYAIGENATPHEPIHAWKQTLPPEKQVELDFNTRNRYSDEEFDAMKRQYAVNYDPDAVKAGKSADEILGGINKDETADQYTINEIQAENLMTLVKAGESKSLGRKIAKGAAGVLSAVGVEPLQTMRSQSEALQFPLKHQEVTALGEALKASKPPGGEQSAGEKAASRNVEGLAEKFPDKAASIGILGEAQKQSTGVDITYAAAPGETPEDVQSASPLAGKKARAASVEAARELPTWARNPWWKRFFPDRTFVTKKGKLQTGGWAPEIFQANAYHHAKDVAPHDEMRNLSPYEIDKSTGFYTPNAWTQLTADVQTAVKNWRDGRTASGTPVVVPDELTKQSGGQIYQPRVGPGGGPLDQAKADFISHLMGHQLPETPRIAKSFPLNVAGQEISAATIPGRVGGPSRGEFGTYGGSEEERAAQLVKAQEMGVEGRQLLEVNPFRLKLDAAAKAAGVKSPKPLSVYQKLNHERILRIDRAPEGTPDFGSNTVIQAAGFEPSIKKLSDDEGYRLVDENGNLVSSQKFPNLTQAESALENWKKDNTPEALAAKQKLREEVGQLRRQKEILDSYLQSSEARLKSGVSGLPRFEPSLHDQLRSLDDTADQEKAKQAAAAYLRNKKSPFANEAGLSEKERKEYYESLGQKVPEREPQPSEIISSKTEAVPAKGLRGSAAELDAADVLPARFEPTQFNSQTEAGKDLEKEGFSIQIEVYGNTHEYNVIAPDGDIVSTLTVNRDPDNPRMADVGFIYTAKEFRRKGLAEALYREAGTQLQKEGVKVLGGLTMSDAPRVLRKKVFGPPVKETVAKRLPNQKPGLVFKNTISAIRPEARFEPKTFVVRHGSTEMNSADKSKDRIRGWTNVPLDEKGQKEAEVAAEQFRGKGLQHIYSSDLDRTIDTAKAIQRATGAAITEEPGFRPWHLGPEIEGHTTKESLPKIQKFIDNPDTKPSGGESLNEFKDRFLNAFHTVQQTHPNEHVAIVTHYRGSKLLEAWRDTGVDNDTINQDILGEYSPDKKPGNIEVLDKQGNLADDKGMRAEPGPRLRDDWPDRLPGRFWLEKSGKILPVSDDSSHDDVAVENRLGGERPQDGLDYRGAMLKGHVRGVADANKIYLDNWDRDGRVRPFSSLPRTTRQAIEDLAFQYNRPVSFNSETLPLGRESRHEPNFNSREISKDIWNKVKQTGGGFTYNPYTRKFLTTGYAASIYPDKEISKIIEPNELNQQTLEKFIDNNKNLLTRAENSVGGWLDPESGKLFLDVSFTTPSRPLAEFAGRQYNQKAIGDLAKYAAGEKGDVPTGGTGEPLEDMTPSHQRVDELLKDYDWEQPAREAGPEQGELIPGLGSRAVLSSKEVGEMSKAELQRHYPEAVIPKRRKELLYYDITNAPKWKSQEHGEAVKTAAGEVEKFARERIATPEFQDGLKWYSEFVLMLKKAYGKHSETMAQLLAATSPRNSPTPNFAMANDAIESYKAGRFDKQIKKYLDGLKMIEKDSWQSWYNKQKGAGKLVREVATPTPATFINEWIEANDLTPRQTNGKLYGMHSVPVLQVLAGNWLTKNTGPKTLQFIKNLLGVHHGATIDIWAARTMRRLGNEGLTERWRILPGNETGVSDKDFSFSQEAFSEAASRLGVKPDALQGALWFAEKKLWAERGWGRLDFGDFRKEIQKQETLNMGIQSRLTKPAATQELLDLITPRQEK